jgi:replicative DNA helicase
MVPPLHNPPMSFHATEPALVAGLVNYEAEQALLGAILTRNEIWFEAAAIIRAEHFADALHARIFDAIGRMVKAGARADVITLKAEFETDPALVGHGGAQYLARLAASVVVLLNAGTDYGAAIRDLWMRRQLIAKADDLRAAAADTDRPADELMAATLGELTALSGEGRQTAISKRAVAESLVEGIMQPAPCYSTGIESFDEAIGGGLYSGKLYGIGARKKVGKTVLLGTVSHNLSRARVPHLFVALEMSPAEIEQRNVARELGINSIQFLRQPSKDLARKVADYSGAIADGTIYEGAPGASFDDLRRMVGRAVVRHRIKGVILDYLQLVGGRPKSDTEEQHTRAVAQWLADFCRKHGLWCLLACQLNQEGNTRGGEGLKLACDVYFTLNREKGAVGAWLEMQESRCVPYANVGSSEVPGLWMHSNGPYFDDVAPLSARAAA